MYTFDVYADKTHRMLDLLLFYFVSTILMIPLPVSFGLEVPVQRIRVLKNRLNIVLFSRLLVYLLFSQHL